MNWQGALVAIALTAWVAMHPWLVRIGRTGIAKTLIGVEVIAFVLLVAWASRAVEAGPSVGMANGLLVIAGIAFLLVPAMGAAIALWNYRPNKAATGKN